MLHGYAYLVFISVSSPPLPGVYGILCCIHLVKACVLLNISLYWGKRFWIYLVDFVAVNLVSCMVMIAGLLIMLLARFSRLGRAVFNEEAFQVMMCVWWHVV